MFRRTLPLVLIIIAAAYGTTATAQTSPLSDRDVAAAIEAGERRRHAPLIASCVAGAGGLEQAGANLAGGLHETGGYTVTLTGAPGRIALQAAEGRRLYKPITVSDVGPDLREPGMFLTVTPQSPYRATAFTIRVAAPIETVVLRDGSGNILQLPEPTVTPVSWTNLFGATYDSTVVVSRIPTEVFRAMPDDDMEIIVVTRAGERRCQIDRADRSRVMRVVATRSR